MKNRILAAVALVAGIVAGALLHSPTTCADDTSCSVTGSSYADAILNPPKGEDTDFFVNSGGVPNVMFLLDTSGSMIRLPPDGASNGWGSFDTTPNHYGCQNAVANSVVYHSPCGTTTLESLPYSSTTDFAQAKDATGKYCPYMSQGNQPLGTDKPGFDPDFYPTYFTPAKIYRDATVTNGGTDDGWSDTATSPASEADATTFCKRWATDTTKQTACNTCFTSQGYFFDGSYDATYKGPSCADTETDCRPHGYGTCVKDSSLIEWKGNNDNTAHCRLPNVWFSGNFLNFYPPKFIVARKVLKDVLASVRKFRLGLTVFNGSDGGKLLDKINPGCNLIGSPSNFDSNRTSIKNDLNNSNKVNFGGGTPLAEALLDVGTLYTTKSLDPWNGTSYHSSAFEDAVSTSNTKSVCFACQASAVLVITDGAPSVDGNIPGSSYASDPMTKTQADKAGSYNGMPKFNITDIADADCPVCNTAAEAADVSVGAGNCLGQQSSGACDDSNNAIQSYLPKVAWYLKNVDLRSDTEKASDGFYMTGKQTLTTYTIGLGTRGNASIILRHAADAGGGLYNGVDPKGAAPDIADAKALRDAILKVLEDVNTRSTSFGAASLSTLQSSATQGVLVPRFEPSRSAHWNGHLYAFDLYSEFTGNSPSCVPKPVGQSGPANGDYDCDGRCTSVFLKDADGDFIQEDGTGAFVKNEPANYAACGNGNQCAKYGLPCGNPSKTKLATPKWDAGQNLSPVKITRDASGNQVIADNGAYLAWANRKIYTVVDSNTDGKFTSADPVIEVNEANAPKLVPFLNLRGRRICDNLVERLTTAGNPAGAVIDADLKKGSFDSCATVIVQYVRGADVFNERACAEWTSSVVKTSGGTLPTGYCTRAYQFGDVFHSSPVEVWPPLPSTGYLCSRGLHPQCLASLYSSSIPNPPATDSKNANAYDDYALNGSYKHRRKYALVGANDGMLHAITTGVWRKADDDRTTPDESKEPYDGFHEDRPKNAPANTIGYEMWGFIPPDLLPKLHLLLESTHHFFVDGTPMVRDVWIDGGNANKAGSVNADGIRQAGEFHTVAVVGERRGGTHYFALDVTDAGDDLDGKPGFLWLYPQPNDPEELSFGETYVEFVPKPPPIGPVRIDAGAPPCSTTNPVRKEFATASGATRCFEERWVVFLSGGFDPQYTKGRGVHMVDLGSGQELFDFSQPKGSGQSCTATSNPACHLNYPVAATVGMMMWGKEANFQTAAALDGYFDTATFGDTGGQLWVLRFSDPGTLDKTTGKATNWFGARVMQQGKSTALDCGLNYCGGQPFFYITSNLALQANGLYRVLAGTGDRYNLLDPVGGVCGPDNLRACIAKGCTVTLQDGSGNAGAQYGVEPMLGKETYGMSHPALCAGTAPATYTYSAASTPSGTTCTTVTAKIDKLSISCPSSVTCSTSAETSGKTASITCNGSGTCDPSASNEFGLFIDTKASSTYLASSKNWFFSVQVFEKDATATRDRRIFSDLAGAQAYDKGRLGEADLVDINAHDATPKTAPLATPGDLGWKYYFDHGEPSAPADLTLKDNATGLDTSYHIYRTDERNASVSAVEAGCTFWNTMQTAVPNGMWDLTTECPVNSPCKAARSQVSYLYGASPSTGGLCLYIDGAPTRSQLNVTLVPPHIGKLVAYVSSGQVSFGLTSVRIPQGGSNVALGEAQDVSAPVQWLPVDRVLHDCRHAPKDKPPAECK